jgi:choline dehydrogenase-like flavoprotein
MKVEFPGEALPDFFQNWPEDRRPMMMDLARTAFTFRVSTTQRTITFCVDKRNPYPMGSVTHEAGGARMGHDPQKSVLDGWNRCHDIKNLLVVDAAAFVSHPEKSITLTIMALAMRASEHLAEELRLSA